MANTTQNLFYNASYLRFGMVNVTFSGPVNRNASLLHTSALSGTVTQLCPYNNGERANKTSVYIFKILGTSSKCLFWPIALSQYPPSHLPPFGLSNIPTF